MGRPKNTQMEIKFLEKLRGNKLQIINAECQMEICLGFYSNDQNNDQISRNQLDLIQIINLQKKKQLSQQFDKFRQAWKFEEFEQELPKYFFDDGCDLSYILHSIQQQRQEPFTAGELIFLQLLCLWEKKLLNKAILSCYIKKKELLQELMEKGLEKLRARLRQQAIVENKREYEEPQMQEREQGIVENRSEYEESQMQEEVSESVIQEEQSELIGQDQIAVKTINYICWAYFYIAQNE